MGGARLGGHPSGTSFFRDTDPMDTFLHGAEVINVDDGVSSIATVSTSVIGIVGTAPFADEVTFPLNTPVVIAGSRTKAALLLASALDTDIEVGTLPSAIDDIFNQQPSVVVVIRVEEGTDDADTFVNVLGGINGAGVKSGIQALINAESVTGSRPRLLIAPGFTGATNVGGILAVAGAAGVGYTPGSYDIAATGGGGTGGVVTVVVGSGGAITARTVKSAGAGYTTAPTFSLTALGGGNGGTVTVTLGNTDNAAAVALNTIAERLLAVAITDGPDTSTAAATAAAGLGSERVYMADVSGVKAYRGDLGAKSYPSAIFAGVQAYVDNARGWWSSLSNTDIKGITATARPIDWSLSDSTCEANLLNAAFVGTIVRTPKGYRTWGNRTLSGDFMCVIRTRDIVNASVLAAQLDAIDKGITKNFVEHVVGEVNAYLRYLKSLGAILGGVCVPSPDLNTPESVSQGKLWLDFDIGPTYPNEHMSFRSSINNGYITSVFQN